MATFSPDSGEKSETGRSNISAATSRRTFHTPCIIYHLKRKTQEFKNEENVLSKVVTNTTVHVHIKGTVNKLEQQENDKDRWNHCGMLIINPIKDTFLIQTRLVQLELEHQSN